MVPALQDGQPQPWRPGVPDRHRTPGRGPSWAKAARASRYLVVLATMGACASTPVTPTPASPGSTISALTTVAPITAAPQTRIETSTTLGQTKSAPKPSTTNPAFTVTVTEAGPDSVWVPVGTLILVDIGPDSTLQAVAAASSQPGVAMLVSGSCSPTGECRTTFRGVGQGYADLTVPPSPPPPCSTATVGAITSCGSSRGEFMVTVTVGDPPPCPTVPTSAPEPGLEGCPTVTSLPKNATGL